MIKENELLHMNSETITVCKKNLNVIFTRADKGNGGLKQI